MNDAIFGESSIFKRTNISLSSGSVPCSRLKIGLCGVPTSSVYISHEECEYSSCSPSPIYVSASVISILKMVSVFWGGKRYEWEETINNFISDLTSHI